MSCSMSARQRACQQPCPGPPGNDDFLNSGSCEISTVSTTTAPGNNDVLNESNDEVSTVSSTTSPGTCKPAQQGPRPPCSATLGKVNLHDLHNGETSITVYCKSEFSMVFRQGGTMESCLCGTKGKSTYNSSGACRP